MTPLSITMNLDIDPWIDVVGQLPLNPDGETAKVERIGLLPNATVEGRATACFLVRLPDGTQVVAETTWRLFHSAHQALAASPVVALEES